MTWLGFLVVHYYFQPIDLFVPAIMMGGSVVGFAYYLEKKLDKKRFMNLWKTIFIVIGFLAVYYLLKEAWSRFLVADILELTSIVMIIKSGKEGESVTKDEATNRAAASRKQLEDCC